MKHTIVAFTLSWIWIVVLAFAQHNGQPPRLPPPAPHARVLSRAEFDELLAQPEKLLIVDVRRPDEVTNIGGFPVFLSVQAGEIPDRLAWIPRDRTIVTISNHAVRAGQAADLLARNGFRVAGAIGAQTYEDAGGKLAKVSPPPAKKK